MNNANAFTLLEMILALGVACIVLITVTTVLFAALHLREATADIVDSAAPLDQTFAFVRRDLQCVVAPTNGTSKILSGGFRAGTIMSAGVSDPVAVEMFTATGALSEKSPWGDIQRVTYELKSPANTAATGKDLVRSVTRNLLAISTVEVSDQLMMSGVKSVKFSGYDGATWQDTWDTTDTSSMNTNLPQAVRVEIQMAGDSSAKADPIQFVVPIDVQSRTNRMTTGTGS